MKRRNLTSVCAIAGVLAFGITACSGADKDHSAEDQDDALASTAEKAQSRDDLLTEQIEWVAEQEALVKEVSAQQTPEKAMIDGALVPDAGYQRNPPYSSQSYDSLKRDGVTYFQTGCDDDNGIKGTRPIVALTEGMLWRDTGYAALTTELSKQLSEIETGDFLNEESIGKDNMPGQEITVRQLDTWASDPDGELDLDEIEVVIKGACIALDPEEE